MRHWHGQMLLWQQLPAWGLSSCSCVREIPVLPALCLCSQALVTGCSCSAFLLLGADMDSSGWKTWKIMPLLILASDFLRVFCFALLIQFLKRVDVLLSPNAEADSQYDPTWSRLRLLETHNSRFPGGACHQLPPSKNGLIFV